MVMTIASQYADLGKLNKVQFSLHETLMDHYEWVQLRHASTLLKIFFSSCVCPAITMEALCKSAMRTFVVFMLMVSVAVNAYCQM